MDRHGLRPRDGEGILLISTALLISSSNKLIYIIGPEADFFVMRTAMRYF